MHSDLTIQQIRDRVTNLSKNFSLKYDRSRLLNILFKRIDAHLVSILLKMMNIVEEIYKDRWDIQFTFKPELATHRNTYGGNAGAGTEFTILNGITIGSIDLVIHFPDITIRNSHRTSLDLKDLFIKIPLEINLDGRSFVINNLLGTRATLTIAEYECQYLHSHLIGLRAHATGSLGYSVVNLPATYTVFCTGTGDINILRALLSNEAHFDEDLFRSFLFLLQSFAEWESLEGMPYMRMSNVVAADYDYPDYSIGSCIEIWNNQIRAKLRDGEIVPDLNWEFSNGRYAIVNDEALEDFFRKSVSIFDAFLYRDTDGAYFTRRRTAASALNFNEWLPFKGEKIPFKVDGEIREPNQGAPKYIHPKIKMYVAKKLEYEVNSILLREIGAGRQDKSNSVQTSNG